MLEYYSADISSFRPIGSCGSRALGLLLFTGGAFPFDHFVGAVGFKVNSSTRRAPGGELQ